MTNVAISTREECPCDYRLPDWSELTVVQDASRGVPARAGKFVVPPDVTHVFGGYWDVYKMAFLSGGRLVGIPFPMYPNRFPGWSRGLGPGRGKLLVLHPEASAKKPGRRPSARNWERGSSDRRRRPTGGQPSGPYGNRKGAIPPS